MHRQYSISEEIVSLGGRLLYTELDPPETKMNEEKNYQYLAEFPDEEEFEVQVIERLEDFVARHSLKREGEKVFLFFDSY